MHSKFNTNVHTYYQHNTTTEIFWNRKNSYFKKFLKKIKFKILRYSVSSLFNRELNSTFNNASLNVTILLEV